MSNEESIQRSNILANKAQPFLAYKTEFKKNNKPELFMRHHIIMV